MSNSSWLDKAIESVAPRYALKRARARVALDLVRKYEGASSGRRTENWKTSSTSPNAEILPALGKLRNRSRDLVRNNGYANKAIRSISANTVGTGIIPQAKTKNKRTKADIQTLWEMWAESTQCDANGMLDFYGIQNLAMREIAEAGEVLIRRRRRPSSAGLPIPLQLQVLEPDHIDTTKNEMLPNGNRVIQGIEFDSTGSRVAYYLHPDHPGDAFYTKTPFAVPERVPASEIRHLFRVERAGQARGIPWGAPAIIRLRDFDEYSDAQLTRQKIAACFTAFVHDPEGSELTDSERDLGERVEPGMIEILPPGKNVTFGTPPIVTGFKEYSDVTLHEVAAAYGPTYEELTGDLSGVNFSSGRMGWLAYWREIEQWRWQVLIPGLCNGVWGWFLDGAQLVGYQTKDVTATWTPPRRQMIDPTKEVPAQIQAIRGGITTLSETIRELGNDPEALLNEKAEDNEKLDDLGLVVDSDPRKVNASGSKQVTTSDSGSDEEDSDENV